MKYIGVCVALTHAEITREFIYGLNSEAEKEGFRLVCFNSIIDKKYSKAQGADEIFRLIPYEYLDAIVILHGTIENVDILNEITREADKASIPVIMARENTDEMLSVSGKYEDAFRELIHHIVIDHNRKDVFFISGRNDFSENPNTDSAYRYRILTKTLIELGIEFNNSKMACGEYWEHPTMKIIDDLVESGEKMPDAIFCGNDIMALTAIKRLEEHGYKVPEDIIVTGFDGLQCSRFASPSITTVSDNVPEMSRLIIEMIMNYSKDSVTDLHKYYKYKIHFAESCGCKTSSHMYYEEHIKLFNSFRLNEADEDRANRWLGDLFQTNNLSVFNSSLKKYFTNEQVLLLRQNEYILDESDEYNHFGRKYQSQFVASIPSYHGRDFCSLDEVYANCFSNNKDGILIFSTVFDKDKVLGVYGERIKDIYSEGATYHRHVNTIQKGLLACITQEKNNVLLNDLERNKYIDSITGLHNLRGYSNYFEEFKQNEKNHQKYFEYCVFSFINHDDILANHKTAECEKCIRFISEKLIESHPEGTYVARISTEGFVVIMPGKDIEDRKEKVWRAVSTFYNAIMDYNADKPWDQQIEVSSGSIQLDPGWEGDSVNYTNSAYIELHKNRIALHGSAETNNGEIDFSIENEKLISLNLILENNRLTYHMQPIVDAYSGEIIAYEALMRTTGDVVMSPFDILSIAKRHRMLPEIERITMFGIFKTFRENIDTFNGKSLFINTIPGCFLLDEDANKIVQEYSDLLENVVIEITEDDTLTTDELNRIKTFGNNGYDIKVAIDDFGTGYSNIMNLLQYDCQVIKIDRFLITDLHLDKNKQMFVSNIISFARDNNVLVLAEGVETKEEMEMAISLGVDLLQGFYLAKPSAEILTELPQSIVNEIMNCKK